MKKFILLTLFISFTAKTHAQVKPEDRLLGVWLNADKDGKIEIYKRGNKYFGKLIWAKDMYKADGKTSVKDDENPDPKLKTLDLKDLVILTDFVYKDEEWTDGNIYDPDSGKTYHCNMTMKDGKLRIRGYIGISLFGRTEVWTRVN